MRFSGVLYQREAVVFFQETVLRAWKEVDDALTAYREAQHPRADLGRSVTEDQAALQAATERYSEGAIDFLNIVTTHKPSCCRAKMILLSKRRWPALHLFCYTAL
jgi:hypothetical protein